MIYVIFVFPLTVKITPIIVSPKSEPKKPLKRLLQKPKPAEEEEKDWELVPPDGGWGW